MEPGVSGPGGDGQSTAAPAMTRTGTLVGTEAAGAGHRLRQPALGGRRTRPGIDAANRIENSKNIIVIWSLCRFFTNAKG